MILRSYRDVEVELRKLLGLIDDLRNAKVVANGVTTEQVIALINQRAKDFKPANLNPVKFQPEDIDSTNHGGEIIHHLIHHFLENVIFGDVEFTGTVTGLPSSGGNPFQYIQIKQVPVVPGEWRIGNEAVNKLLQTTFGDGGSNVFQMEFEARATTFISRIFFDGELGHVDRRLSSVATKNLAIFPGTGSLPANGMMLYAKDAQGNVEWRPAPADINFNQQVRQSTDTNLGAGTFVSLPGCSITLTATGAYYITANACIQFLLNDSEATIRAVQNQPGAFFEMSGYAIVQKVAADSGRTIMASQSWILNVSTVPCTVKLEGMKVGTGATKTFQDHTTLLAIKVG